MEKQAEQNQKWWQKARKPLEIFGIIVVCILIIVLLGVIVMVYLFDVNVPGLRGKTLWDWLQLLIIPAVLAVGGYVINLTISRSEQEATKQRAQSEREAADKRAETERKISEDNQRETALQAYIDKISELLLQEKMRESTEDDEVRNIARVRTLSVLPRLDPIRKKSVLQFLYESGLIDKSKCILDLRDADFAEVSVRPPNYSREMLPEILSGSFFVVNLKGAALGGVNLKGADLSTAQLREAMLTAADLRGSRLVATDLSGADLTRAYLSGADLGFADLREANFMGAHLTKAILVQAILLKTNFAGSDLTGAQLSDSQLQQSNLSSASLLQANMSGAHLHEAKLRGANLTGANLMGANLMGADLTGAIVTHEQLDKAKSLKGATMPDGSIYP